MKTKVLFAAVLLAGAQAWSASVTWDYARNISATNDMPQGLTVVAAMNAGASVSVTWEGVVFEGDNGYGNADFAFSSGPGHLYPGFVTGLPLPKLSGAKKDLITSANWDSPDMVVSNLTIGQDYTIQIWASDCRFGQRYREMTIDDGNGNTVTLRENVYRIEGSLGQYVLGTFTADSTNQTFSFSQTPSAVSLINAVVLYSGTPTFGSQPTDASPDDSATMEYDTYSRPINGASDLLSLTVASAVTAGGTNAVTMGGTAFSADGTASITIFGDKTVSGMVPGPQGSTDPVVSQDAIDLLDSARTNAGGIILTGLSLGTTYTVQIWANDSLASAQYATTQIGSPTRLARNNMKAVENSLGQYQLCKFTANGAVQAIPVGGAAAVVNAVVVYNGDYTFDTNPPSVLPVEPTSPWQTPQPITGNADFILNQTLVKAINIGSANTATVAGISFMPDDGSVNGSSYGGFMGGADSAWTATNADYTTLMNDAHYNVTTVTLSSLTPGKTYTLQLWVNDTRAGIGSSRTVRFLLGGATSDELQESVSTNYNLGEYVIAVFTAGDATESIGVLAYQNGASKSDAAVMPCYALYEGAPGASDPFDDWASSQGLSGSDADMTADPDADGANNLYEYALGGDPNDAADTGTNPVCRVTSSGAQYVHVERLGDSDLSYQVLVKADLMATDWTTNYTSTPGGSGWKNVTNNVPVDTDEKFIKLGISRQ